METNWKKPARLWRRRKILVAGTAPGPQALAAGSLEEMVRRAIACGAAAAEERDTLFIAVDAKQLFAWKAIQGLYKSSAFPIEI